MIRFFLLVFAALVFYGTSVGLESAAQATTSSAFLVNYLFVFVTGGVGLMVTIRAFSSHQSHKRVRQPSGAIGTAGFYHSAGDY